MVLGPEQHYCVSLCEEMYSIQLTFLLHGNNASAEQRMELFQYIQCNLEVLMQDFMQASRKPKAYVPCCYDDCNKLHVELHMLSSKEHQHCPTVEKPIPPDYYSDLFPPKGL